MTAKSVYLLSCNGSGCIASYVSMRISAVDARHAAKANGWTSFVLPASREQKSPAVRTRDLCPSCTAKAARS